MKTLQFYLGKLDRRELETLSQAARTINDTAIEAGEVDPLGHWLGYYIDRERLRRFDEEAGMPPREVEVILVPQYWSRAEVQHALTRAASFSYCTLTPAMAELFDEMTKALIALSSHHLREAGATI